MVSVDVKHQERKNFSGQVGGDKECPFNAVTNYVSQSVEEACRKARLGACVPPSRIPTHCNRNSREALGQPTMAAY